MLQTSLPDMTEAGAWQADFFRITLRDVQEQEPSFAGSSSANGLAIDCLAVVSLQSSAPIQACSANLGLLVNVDLPEACWFQGLGLGQ